MPVPSPRNPIRPARGVKADLDANISLLYEGEIVFAQDEDKLYVVEGGALVAVTSAQDAGDSLQTNIQNATQGQALLYDGARWRNGGPMDGGNF